MLQSDPICGHQIEAVLPLYNARDVETPKKPQSMNGQQGKIDLIRGIPCDHVKCNSINVRVEASVSKVVIEVFC